MNEHDPNLGRNPSAGNEDSQTDRRGRAGDGRSGMALLAALVGIALVGGFLYFGNWQNGAGNDQAQTSAGEQTIERSATDASSNPGPIAPTTTPPGTTATPPGPADTAPIAPRNQE